MTRSHILSDSDMAVVDRLWRTSRLDAPQYGKSPAAEARKRHGRYSLDFVGQRFR